MDYIHEVHLKICIAVKIVRQKMGFDSGTG